MIQSLIYSLIGTPSERTLKKYRPLLEAVNALEAQVQSLPDEAFPQKTVELKEKVRQAVEDKMPQQLPEDEEAKEKIVKAVWQEVLDGFLPEAFALTREASRRSIGLRQFDVQILGGIVLHNGAIAEMRTGEGKTLVATAPAYLNCLLNRGTHIVTVNDYLAKRDCEWMGKVFRFLGLTVGYVQHDMPNEERRAAYASDVTYVTNNEVGFDYLRDNMVVRKEDRVLRPLHFAIIDEVDSILIDEARTPLIISGAAEKSTDRYAIINRIIPALKVRKITEEEEIQAKYTGEDLSKGYDAIVDEKNHTAVLTEDGIQKCEKLLGIPNLYDDLEGEWVHHITQALRAHHLYSRDVDYVVKDGEVIIVDEFTGRLMPGRRWSDGLHQAVETKEHLPPKEENQTLATITFQNFFKLYKKMAGMTGTAMTEEDEFLEIYGVPVYEIPTHQKMIRQDFSDLIYRTEREKYRAIADEIKELWKTGRPVLVGTRSIEKSEKLSAMLRSEGIPHQVLNAKYHEQEAQIIAQAGRKGAVTIATNMAGRGTDILLGGNPQDKEEYELVKSLGGLHVLGTERHEARRIDNQLRGRCGRQGDPGSSRFYLALDDELMRLFGSDRLSVIMEKLGMKEGEVIESRLVSRQIEGAQRRVETHHFDVRKQLLDYDNVMNKQREAIYRLRNGVLDNETITPQIHLMMEEDLRDKIEEIAPGDTHAETWDIPTFKAYLERVFGVNWSVSQEEIFKYDKASFLEETLKAVKALYLEREKEFEGFDFREIERMILLQMIDRAWKGHLYDLDHLKKSIGLRAYGQKDPKIEYQRESFILFEAMLAKIREQVIEYLFKVEAPKIAPPRPAVEMTMNHQEGSQGVKNGRAASKNALEKESGDSLPELAKIGRNDPCYCGSGKKYKKCHGA